MKFRPAVVGTASFLMFLSACSADPYENAGSCNTLGQSRIFDGGVQVCIGVDNDLKWYLNGKYFDDFELLGRIQVTRLTTDDYRSPDIQNPDTLKYLSKLFDSPITQDEIAKYAKGDTRWDSLIEAITKRDNERAIQESLLEERFRTEIAWKSNKGSRQAAYDAYQAQVKHLGGAMVSADNYFVEKLSVLTSEINQKYGIESKTVAIPFLAQKFKAQDLAMSTKK